MKYFPKLILISGNGRNVGKTTLACSIIKKFSKDIDIVSLKISPHIHNNSKGVASELLIKTENCSLFQENNHKSNKDSSRMLKSGAKKAFYLQVNDNSLEQALTSIENYIDFKSAIVCESAWLRRYYEPGLLLVLNESNQTEVKENYKFVLPLADRKIIFNGQDFDFNLNNILYSDLGWELK